MPDIRCDDWSCPAMPSCARHLWRTREYWRMDGFVYAMALPREPDDECCDQYERDVEKEFIHA